MTRCNGYAWLNGSGSPDLLSARDVEFFDGFNEVVIFLKLRLSLCMVWMGLSLGLDV